MCPCAESGPFADTVLRPCVHYVQQGQITNTCISLIKERERERRGHACVLSLQSNFIGTEVERPF
jgi:hypothetical protein